MVDIAIIGGGPAGISAAIQARQRELSTTLIAREDAKGALVRAPLVENYPGIPNEDGARLLATLKAHAQAMGTVFHNGKVTSILKHGGGYALGIGNDFVEAKALIIATGARQPKLLPGEQELIGQGISYCATCDGMLYRGSVVGVLGDSEHAISESNFLAEIASEVWFFGKPDDRLHPSIRQIPERIEAILVKEGKFAGVLTKAQEYTLHGLFIERDQMALNTLLSDLEMDNGFIKVDRAMRTNLPRVFAAGDCTGGPLQVAKAVGEGCVAAYTAAQELQD